MRRTDVLGAKMVPLNDQNDRLQAMDMANKSAVDAVINPNYTLVEKRAPAASIKDNVTVKEPPNLPDKLLYPEHWEHYNPDHNVVKPNTKVGGVFAVEDFLTFKLKDKEREMLRQYLQFQHRVPEPGYYDPIFTLLEEGVPIPTFDRYLERSRLMTREELMQRDIDGDVLILDPAQPASKGGNLVNYEKMPGRPEDKRDGLTDVLDLDLNYGQIEKKPTVLVDMVES